MPFLYIILIQSVKLLIVRRTTPHHLKSSSHSRFLERLVEIIGERQRENE